MGSPENKQKIFYKAGILALCLTLAICLLYKPVQQTIAYITATSVTCTNTFSDQISTEPTEPTEQTESTHPSEPTHPSQATDQTTTPATDQAAGSMKPGSKTKTNDGFHLGIWGITAIISLLALVFTVLFSSRKTGRKRG